MRDTYARNDNLSRRPASSSPARFSTVGADLPEHRRRALVVQHHEVPLLEALAQEGSSLRGAEILVGQVLEAVEAPRRCPGRCWPR